MRRFPLALALLLAAAALVGVARPAGACTCAPFDTRAALAASDAAFVGTFESRTDPPPVLGGTPAGGSETVYRFRVDQAVKGPLGGEVEVRSPGSEDACGLSTPSGRPVGVLLSERDGHYHGDLCRQPSPERLQRAAEPLPPHEGLLPPWILVGSTYGNGRSVALDDGGKVAGVGSGAGTTTAVAVCPDRQRVVELFTVKGNDDTDTQGITVRRLDTMTTETERLLPELRPARAGVLACRDAAATDVVLLTRDGVEADGYERLVRLVAGQETAVLWEGPAALHAAFGPGGRTAYLNLYPQGEEILAVEVDRPGEAGVVARVPAGSGPMVASSDGRRLATVAVGSSRPSQIVTVDLGASHDGTPPAPGPPAVSAADLGSAGVTGDVQWTGDRLVFMPALRPAEPVRIYDPGLTVLASWAGWTAEHSVVIGERLYGASQGAVRFARLTTGPGSVVRELEDALVVSVADVSPPAVEPPAPAPATTTTSTAPAVAPTTTTTVPKASPTTTTTSPAETTTTTAPAPERSRETRREVAGPPATKGGGGGAGGVLALGGVLVLVAGGAVAFRRFRR